MISVVIPCYNAAQWLPEALASLQGQECLAEVILVDDHSTDGSVCIAQSYTSLPIKTMSSPGRGVSVARNAGLRRAVGEWIQFLDADDVLLPGKLKRQHEIGITHRADVVYGSWQIYQEQEDCSFQSQQVREPDYSGDCAARLLSADSFCQIGAMLFRHNAVLEVDGFAPDMLCVEDINLYLRLAFSGARFVRDIGDVSLLHRKHKTTCSLGTRDPQEFYAGCFINSTLAESVWRQKGGILSGQQQQTLLQAYGYLARSYFEHDRPKFYEILSYLYRLDANYLPSAPAQLKFLSCWVGYEKAELVALVFRRVKKSFRQAFQKTLLTES